MPRTRTPTGAEPRSETLTLRVNELRSVKVLLQGGAPKRIIISRSFGTGYGI